MLGVDLARAQRRVETMRGAFERAMVDGVGEIADAIHHRPKDRHVLDAAVLAGAQSVVTFNLKDFRTEGTAQDHSRAEQPDQFLANLFHLYPDILTEIITTQAAGLTKGGRLWTPEDILDGLARQECRCFAELVRGQLQDER